MFRKDHKVCEDQEKGPPVRPLCDVSDSYGHKLSFFISNILKEVTDKEETSVTALRTCWRASKKQMSQTRYKQIR